MEGGGEVDADVVAEGVGDELNADGEIVFREAARDGKSGKAGDVGGADGVAEFGGRLWRSGGSGGTGGGTRSRSTREVGVKA